MPFHIKLMLKKGLYGLDIHKENKPKVAEMGGLVLIIAVTISLLLLLIIVKDNNQKISIFVFLSTILIAAIIGIIDDLVTLNAIVKPLLLMIASIPIIVTKSYDPHPVLPFVGSTRLTIIYLILLPFAISVPANAVNMLDVFNGSMPTTVMIVLASVFAANAIIFGFNISELNLINIYIIVIFSVLVGYWIFNKYPSRVFSGDTGSLMVGAAIGAIAVMGHLEVVMIVSLIPFIMNSFGIISSLKGFVERHNMPAKATVMTSDWKLKANKDHRAPITLTGLILQEGPLHETDVVRSFNILTIISGLLTIVTAFLIKMVI
ncbi:MAG: hypothetical protein ACTSYD_13215 [Candidatus Heimdallarchaeaceae archaeon]